MRFGEMLLAERTAKGLSQKRLAKMSGLAKSYLSRLETTDRKPSRPTVELLADTLQLNPVRRCHFFMAAGHLELNSPPELAGLIAALSLPMSDEARQLALETIHEACEDILDSVWRLDRAA